jgi:acetamidase/formamidase
VSDDAIVERGLGSELAVKMKEGGKTVVWSLDRVHGQAFLETPGPHLKQFKVPVSPMLGCVATAPLAAFGSPNSGDSGIFGGNLDFSQIAEGATLYLPVSVPGALFYLGDGHAVQGDGELNGNALETSMDVEFSVDVIPRRSAPAPRVESPTKIMAVGLGGSMDEAVRRAAANMTQWLEEDYKLTPPEIADVLGPAAEIRVSEVADRNAGVVLSLSKALLAPLKDGAQ